MADRGPGEQAAATREIGARTRTRRTAHRHSAAEPTHPAPAAYGTDRRRRRAVWGLLCAEQPHAAKAMAEAIGAPLPTAARVLAVACPGADPEAVAGLLRRASGGRAWIVCGAGADEAALVALLPSDSDEDGGARRLARELTRRHPTCLVGASPVVGLDRVGPAYAQARHALAAAQADPDGYARFHTWLDPELLLVGTATAWARTALAPLTTHRAVRRGDPDAAELLDTLEFRLTSRHTAGARLGIHRNTLSARLRLIERLLGRDLRNVADRAELSLALRVAGLAVPAGTFGLTDPTRAEASDGPGGAGLWAVDAPSPDARSTPGDGSGTPPAADGPTPGADRAHAADTEGTAQASGTSAVDRLNVPPSAPRHAEAPPVGRTDPRLVLPWELPALVEWAHDALRPLAGSLDGPDAGTLRVWLDNHARLAPTAAALCLTVPGARKRLTRIGGVLGLDPLHDPTAEADLWLALRVADRSRVPRPAADRRRAS
ncbi:helix-turn-helix domain-containing protein [Yinghuangia seranimata]|uniref:helix-turn-helix domain-containing protein n=1 Tax=Yinghuangia seranimata TaxID=408067 RepID=UPI00248AAC1C|nr:helix-turn-helix domain-containing protein [Yinghuangia seranimata]MDI2132063.1 helix-turn-helix domain-containing protein [Yinghuangia seranimata]